MQAEEKPRCLELQVDRDGGSIESELRSQPPFFFCHWTTGLLSLRRSFLFCNKEVIDMSTSQDGEVRGQQDRRVQHQLHAKCSLKGKWHHSSGNM